MIIFAMEGSYPDSLSEVKTEEKNPEGLRKKWISCLDEMIFLKKEEGVASKDYSLLRARISYAYYQVDTNESVYQAFFRMGIPVLSVSIAL